MSMTAPASAPPAAQQPAGTTPATGTTAVRAPYGLDPAVCGRSPLHQHKRAAQAAQTPARSSAAAPALSITALVVSGVVGAVVLIKLLL
jgi:hypothetical protein